MIDDFFSATSMVAVSAIVAAAFIGAETESPPAVPAAAATPAATQPATARVAVPAAPADAMPVYQLPRVVVTGHRLRDGDQLASSEPPAPPVGAAPQPRSVR